jgi:hypothetical protein
LHQIKLIIPKTASGTLIGKGGIIIKHMSDSTSCKMQLGDESDPFGTNERLFFVQSASVAHLVHVSASVALSSNSSSSSIAAVRLLQCITLIFMYACLIVVVVRF